MQQKTMEETEDNRIKIRPREREGYTILEDDSSDTGYRQVDNITLIEWYNTELVNLSYITPCQIRNIVFNLYKLELNDFIENLLYAHKIGDLNNLAKTITDEIIMSLGTDPVHNKKMWKDCMKSTESEMFPNQTYSVIDYLIKKNEIEYDLAYHDDLKYYMNHHSEQWSKPKMPKQDYVYDQVMRFCFEYLYQNVDVNYVQDVSRKFTIEDLKSWKVDKLQCSPYGKAFDAKNPNPRVI